MLVEWKNRSEAMVYRGVVLHGPTEVDPEWFEQCKNPNIVEVKKRGRPKKVVENDDSE